MGMVGGVEGKAGSRQGEGGAGRVCYRSLGPFCVEWRVPFACNTVGSVDSNDDSDHLRAIVPSVRQKNEEASAGSRPLFLNAVKECQRASVQVVTQPPVTIDGGGVASVRTRDIDAVLKECVFESHA